MLKSVTKIAEEIYHKRALKPKINADYLFVLYNMLTHKEYKDLSYIQALLVNKYNIHYPRKYVEWLNVIEEKLQDIAIIKDDNLILKDHLKTGDSPEYNYLTEEEYDKIAKEIEEILLESLLRGE